MLSTSSFKTNPSDHMTSVAQTPESKPGRLGYKHVCQLSNRSYLAQAEAHIAVKTTESILSAVTTGWLSHLSDMVGRKKILALSMFGALFMSVHDLGFHNCSANLAYRDLIYILVSDPSTVFGRHGEAFIIVAPLVEGILGAQSTYNGITHA